MTNILIVEDEQVTARQIHEVLQNLGYQISGRAESGQQAVHLAQETHPDLILMDICLADRMDGIMAADHIGQQLSVPIVYLTAHADEHTLERALKTQPFGYLVKPFEPLELRTTIETALIRYRLDQQKESDRQRLRTTPNGIDDEAIAPHPSALDRATQPQNKESERLSQLKDDFLSTVSHELRTPIANIRMATQMLEIGLRRLNVLDGAQPAIEKYFAILKEEGQREINLIDDLLNLSRLEAGVDSLNPIPVDLRIWVTHMVESFSELTTTRQQQLIVDLPELLPLVQVDLFYLERIVTELLTNAHKYTPTGEQIQISAGVRDQWLELCIINTGVEIPAEEIPLIFEKFYRIPKSDRWKHGGTGLGLALARKLTDVIEGRLDVESHDEVTTFTLSLPLLPATTPP